jgi:hypothetical protein
MTAAGAAGVVVDTMVISWLFDDRPNSVADDYRTLIDATPVLLAFQTVMELRHAAFRAGWESCVAVGWNDVSPNSQLSDPTTR